MEIINSNDFTDKNWAAYYQFALNRLAANPFAHIMFSDEFEAFKTRRVQRLAGQKGHFFIYTFWEGGQCIGSLEILKPDKPFDENDGVSYAYFLADSDLFTAQSSADIRDMLNLSCTLSGSKQLRITCSDQNTQNCLLRGDVKWIIHDRIQVLEKDNIDMMQLQAYIDSCSEYLAKNDLSASFCTNLTDKDIADYVVFHNSVVNDIVVLDMENGELPVSESSFSDRYRQLQKQGGEVLSVFLKNPKGDIIGLSQVWISDVEDATEIDGGLTAVQKEYRNRGLGVYVKAMMVKKLCELYPQFQILNTSNSAQNTAILKVNSKLNFQKVSEEFISHFYPKSI